MLRYYSGELQHLRDVGGAFAKEYPKIAGRLGMDEFECADPYVERLLEGFAFLTARLQLKLDAEFPRFAQHLFEIIYPHYLAPTPSMTVVQFQPDLQAGTLAGGISIPRQTRLRSRYPAGNQTLCEYRTAHEVCLWPLELTEASYHLSRSTTLFATAPFKRECKAVLRLRMRVSAGLDFAQLPLDSLSLYLRGAEQVPVQLYEQLTSACVGFIVKPVREGAGWVIERGAENVKPLGFDNQDALIPDTGRTFSGYRLLQEYFAFPERFLFVALSGLREAVQRCNDNECEIHIFFNRHEPALERSIDRHHFALYCTPAINVFPKRCDRVELSNRHWEQHLVADRTRPTDFEIYRVTDVVGYGNSVEAEQAFLPFYAAADVGGGTERRAFFQLRRAPRITPPSRSNETRSSYLGSEIFLSLVDAADTPYRSEIRQLGVQALCTNRDLPIHLPVGIGSTDFDMESGAPITSIRCLVGPSRPRPSFLGDSGYGNFNGTQGDISWRLISHMSLNYLSLCDSDPSSGATSLREMLRLYAVTSDAETQKQIDGLRSISSRPITRRLPLPGPIVFGRGLEIAVEFDDTAYESSHAYLLGAVLERFFARYVAINVFTETVIRTPTRGDIKRWPIQIGQRHVL